MAEWKARSLAESYGRAEAEGRRDSRSGPTEDKSDGEEKRENQAVKDEMRQQIRPR
jgi:hypothetical protein